MALAKQGFPGGSSRKGQTSTGPRGLSVNHLISPWEGDDTATHDMVAVLPSGTAGFRTAGAAPYPRREAPTGPPFVGGSAIALLWLLSCDLVATQCSAPSKRQPTTRNGRSGIWRNNYSVRMACPTAKRTRIKLTRRSPKLVYRCNDANSRIQEGPRPWCTQARSLSARNGEDCSRPALASEVKCFCPATRRFPLNTVKAVAGTG